MRQLSFRFQEETPDDPLYPHFVSQHEGIFDRMNERRRRVNSEATMIEIVRVWMEENVDRLINRHALNELRSMLQVVADRVGFIIHDVRIDHDTVRIDVDFVPPRVADFIHL